MEITYNEAVVVVTEIIQMLAEKGVDLSVLSTFDDYDDLETLVASHDGQRWNTYHQNWDKDK